MIVKANFARRTNGGVRSKPLRPGFWPGLGAERDEVATLERGDEMSRHHRSDPLAKKPLDMPGFRHRKIEPPDREIGWDVSGAVQYRPFMSQNVVLNASAAALLPGKGLKQLYDEDKRGPQYSILFNLLLTY